LPANAPNAIAGDRQPPYKFRTMLLAIAVALMKAPKKGKLGCRNVAADAALECEE